LHPRRVGKPGDADDLLNAEPECLPVFEDQCELGPDADAAVAVEVTGLGREDLRPAADIFFEWQEIVEGQRLHPCGPPKVEDRDTTDAGDGSTRNEPLA